MWTGPVPRRGQKGRGFPTTDNRPEGEARARSPGLRPLGVDEEEVGWEDLGAGTGVGWDRGRVGASPQTVCSVQWSPSRHIAGHSEFLAPG